MIGTSLQKTSLSPLSLSKIYTSMCISRLLYGSEIRHISESELDLYEFHMKMAKEIQCLPQNCPDPVPLSTLGWKKIEHLIDIAKLRFGHMILSLHSESVFRLIFVKRYYSTLANEVSHYMSPAAQFIAVCRKYRLLHIIEDWLASGLLPGKMAWKGQYVKAVNDYIFARWRLQLRLCRKLADFRVVQIFIEPSVWWKISRINVRLKKNCCNMIKLLSGCDRLRINTDIEVPVEQRICTLCDLNKIDDLYHMVMECKHSIDTRNMLYLKIKNCIVDADYRHFISLSKQMQFYILIGLVYPFCDESIDQIRYFSCQGISKMYIAHG